MQVKKDILKLFIVIPAYNEEDNLSSLLASLESSFEILAKFGCERKYIFVDDGSSDETPEIISRQEKVLPMEVITHRLNQGLGPTIRDGLRLAAELSDKNDIVFTMDGDNTHPAGLMICMFQKILEGNDVVIASRYRPGSRIIGLSWHRKLMSMGARALFQLIFPIPGVRDYTCGYRGYRAEVLKDAFLLYGDSFIEYRGFQCMADILLKLDRMQVIMNEVPMILRYDLKQSESKMRVGSTVLNTLKLMIKRRIERPILHR